MKKLKKLLPITNFEINNNKAFTIVELLVFIVVIGILATITIVSYVGISQKAVQSTLQSDISNASIQLKLYYVDNGVYPSSNTCPSVNSSEICLKSSPGNSYNYISPYPNYIV